MPALTHDELTSFLEEPGHLLRLATVDDDGYPRVVPIWFVHDAGRLLFTLRSAAVPLANIRRDPKVGLSIDEAAAPYRKVTVRGVAEIVHDAGADDAWRDTYRTIAKRYTPAAWAEAYVDATVDQARPLLAVDLTAPTTQLSTWRMPATADERPSGIWAARYYTPDTDLPTVDTRLRGG
jgi:PPOX class probable F420-dependent enzyme